MTDAIETINTRFYQYTGQLISNLSKCANCDEYIATLEDLRRRYGLAIADVMIRYYSEKDDATLLAQYYACVNEENFEGEVNAISRTLRRRKIDLPPYLMEPLVLCSIQSSEKKIAIPIERDDEDDDVPYKDSGYEYSRHCKSCVDQVQARESYVFAPEDMKNIRNYFSRDSSSIITYEKMRDCLKSLGLTTKLNDHVPLIIRTIGGRAPPMLSELENMHLLQMLTAIMRIYTMIKPVGNSRSHYQYYLARAIEAVFRGNKERLELLNYIHWQSPNTIVRHDNIYKKICAMAPANLGLKYSAVDIPSR